MLLRLSLLVIAALPGLARVHRPARRVVVPPKSFIPLWPEGGPKCSDITEQQIPNGPFAAVMCAIAERTHDWLRTAVRNNIANTSAEFNIFSPQKIDRDHGTTGSGAKKDLVPQVHGANHWELANTTSLGGSFHNAGSWWPAGFYSAVRRVYGVDNEDLGPHEEKLLVMLTNHDGNVVHADTVQGYYDILKNAGESPMTLWAKNATSKLTGGKAYAVWKGWRDTNNNTTKVQLRDPYKEALLDFKIEEIAGDIEAVLYLQNFDKFTKYARDESEGDGDNGDNDDQDCACARRRRRDKLTL